MSRGFNEEEKYEIRQKLIKELKKSLQVQNIRKISVEELSIKAGIAKGTFYLFFPSKEHLFFEVINQTQDDIVDSIFKISKKQKSAKEKLELIFIELIKQLENHPWLGQMSTTEFDKTIRKLPKQLKDELRKRDIADMKKILTLVGLKPRVKIEQISVITEVIFLSVVEKENFGAQYNSAIKIMIKMMVENLFEEDNYGKENN